jgi:NAD-dependent SIR2 family protein deacetylase
VDELISRAARWIREASGLLITAGAGMGVDSGLPDFRGTEGFWRAYPALAHARRRFEQIASPAAFHDDPQLAWGFYGHRLALYRRTVPHAGFALLRRWADAMPAGAFVFTSNVDGQFQRAGFAAERVAEVHGSIHHLQCLSPCSDAIWSAESFAPDIDEGQCRLRSPLPRCPRCGALARPNVLMFGDGDWISARSDAQHARLAAWMREAGAAVAIELGAGEPIPTVRWFSERSGLRLIRINPAAPEVPAGQAVGLRGGALQMLQAIDDKLKAMTP